MATAHKVRPTSYLSPQYINGIYIPSGLLLVGVAIVKVEWLPYAAVVALILGTWKVFNNRAYTCAVQSDCSVPHMLMACDIPRAPLTDLLRQKPRKP